MTANAVSRLLVRSRIGLAVAVLAALLVAVTEVPRAAPVMAATPVVSA